MRFDSDARRSVSKVACESAELIRDQLALKNDPGLRLLLAKTLVRMGRMDDARAELESALKMSPDDFTANLAMAAINGLFYCLAAYWKAAKRGLLNTGE